MERTAFLLVTRVLEQLCRVRDLPLRRRVSGGFRLYWQPGWLVRWEIRLDHRCGPLPGENPPDAALREPRRPTPPTLPGRLATSD